MSIILFQVLCRLNFLRPLVFIFHQWGKVVTYVHLSAFFPVFGTVFSGSFSHCYLHPSSSSVFCKFLSGGSAACAFIQPSSCFCSFSFVFPLRVGEQSGVPSVGCTPMQRTKDVLGFFGFESRRVFFISSRRVVAQSPPHNLFVVVSLHQSFGLWGACAVVHSSPHQQCFWCCKCIQLVHL